MDATFAIVLGKEFALTCGNDVHFRLRLRSGDAGIHASDNVEVMFVVLLDLLRGEGGGNPELFETAGGIVTRRHDTDDDVGKAIDLDGLAEGAGAAAETISPKSVGDDYDAILAGLSFVVAEDAT